MPRIGTVAQQAASRANGKLGGRPLRRTGSAELQRIRQRARELGESSTLATVRFLMRVRRGKIKGATVADRMRAAESLLDRFGFPRLAQQQQVGEFPVKLIHVDWGTEGDPNAEGDQIAKVVSEPEEDTAN